MHYTAYDMSFKGKKSWGHYFMFFNNFQVNMQFFTSYNFVFD